MFEENMRKGKEYWDCNCSIPVTQERIVRFDRWFGWRKKYLKK